MSKLAAKNPCVNPKIYKSDIHIVLSKQLICLLAQNPGIELSLLQLNSRSRPVVAAVDSGIGNLMTAHWRILQSAPIFCENSASCIMNPEFGLTKGLANLVICNALASVIFSPAENSKLVPDGSSPYGLI